MASPVAIVKWGKGALLLLAAELIARLKLELEDIVCVLNLREENKWSISIQLATASSWQARVAFACFGPLCWRQLPPKGSERAGSDSCVTKSVAFGV